MDREGAPLDAAVHSNSMATRMGDPASIRHSGQRLRALGADVAVGASSLVPVIDIPENVGVTADRLRAAMRREYERTVRLSGRMEELAVRLERVAHEVELAQAEAALLSNGDAAP